MLLIPLKPSFFAAFMLNSYCWLGSEVKYWVGGGDGQEEIRGTDVDMGGAGSRSPRKIKEERSPEILTWVINDPQVIN